MADLKPGDNNNNNQEEELEATSKQPEQELKIEPAEAALMAGLQPHEVGVGAESTSEKQSPSHPENQRPAHEANAQDLANTGQEDTSIYGFGADASVKQYNDALAGAADGKTNTIFSATQTAQTIEEEKEKERRATRATLALLNSVNDLQDYTKGIEQDLEQAEEQLSSLVSTADQAIDTMDEKITELQENLEQQQEELRLLQEARAQRLEGVEVGSEEYNNVTEYFDSQIALKEAQINNTETVIGVYESTSAALRQQVDETQTQMRTARENLTEAKRALDNAGEGADIEALKTQVEKAEQAVQDARNVLGELNKRTEFIQNQFDKVEQLTTEYGGAGVNAEQASVLAAQINLKTQALTTVASAAEDGTIDASEFQTLSNIVEQMNPAGMPEDAKQEMQQQIIAYAKEMADAGIKIQTGENQYAESAEDIERLFLSQWKDIQEEKAEVSDDLDTTRSEMEALRQRIEAAQLKVADSQSDLNEAQDLLITEQRETQQALDDAAAAHATLSQYDDINDYMEQNYSMTVMGGSFGDGENIDTVAQDRNRMLQDDGGNFIYMDNEDQRLYTLAKNEDGSIQLDENGDEKKLYLSAEESLAKTREMYENKLVPRNFVSNDAFPEHSKDDTFAGTLFRSKFGMDKEQTEENIADNIETQKAQELAAQTEAAEAKQRVASLESDIQQKQQAVQNAQSEVSALEQQYAALLAKEAELQRVAKANNVDLPSQDETQIAQTDTTKDAQDENESDAETSKTNTEETAMEAPAPAYDAEYAQYMGQLEQQIGNQSLSEAEIDALLAEAPEGIDLDRVKSDLTEQGRLMTPEQEVAQSLENQTTQAETIYFPLIGASAPLQTISEPTSAPSEYGISPGIDGYVSIMDEPGGSFQKTNDPNNPDAMYLKPIDNRTDNVIAASESFGKAPEEQPKPGQTETPEQILQRLGTATPTTVASRPNAQNDENNPQNTQMGGMAS